MTLKKLAGGLSACLLVACGGGGDDIEITAITPAHPLVGGGEIVTVTGKGFSGLKEATVSVGGQAMDFAIVSDTEITGTVPQGQTASAEVVITKGETSVAFSASYGGLYAADGKGGYSGNLYLVDPRDGYTVTVGAIGFGVTGMEFSPAGELFAVQSIGKSDSPAFGGGGGMTNLLTIDPATGAATHVAMVGQLGDDLGHIPDVTFSGSTLVGWAEGIDDPLLIDTVTGAFTMLGESGTGSAGSGIATLNDGTVLAATSGCTDGAFYNVNVSTGACTESGTLTLASANPDNLEEVNAMAVFRGTLYGVLSVYLEEGDLTMPQPSALASIDPTTGEVTIISALPFFVDALASNEPVGDPVVATVRAPNLLQGCRVGSPRTVEVLEGGTLARTLSSRSLEKRVEQRLSALLSATDHVTVETCPGVLIQIIAERLDSYALVPNQRGFWKLLGPDGTTVMRNVTRLASE
jgi:hypothetical protein